MKKKYYEIQERLDFSNCNTSYDLGKTLFIVENKFVAADFCSKNNPVTTNGISKYFYVEKEFEISDDESVDEYDPGYGYVNDQQGIYPECDRDLSNEMCTATEIVRKEVYDMLKVKGMIDNINYNTFEDKCESFDLVKDLVDEIFTWNDEDIIKDFLASLLY